MKANSFVRELTGLKLDNVFNPYSDHCDIHDLYDAPQKRRILLKKILEAANSVEVDSLWVGRDLGYRGGRRTGLALTDEKHIFQHAEKWGIKAGKFTKGEIVVERTATMIWDLLSQIDAPVFLWNVFPFHPYQPENPFSNRAHNVKERLLGEELLSLLIHYLKPKKIIAIGNDAEKVAVKMLDSNRVIKARHPSYGGQKEFVTQIQKIYHLG